MNDLISRKAAIDALRMDISIIPYAKAREYVGAAIEEIYNRLEALPSVHPDLLDAKEKDNRKKTEVYICGDTGEACTDCVEKCIYKHSIAEECEAVPEGGKKLKDLIERQMAIDALGERPMVWEDDDEYALGERNQYDIDRLAIETVPSAQSKRTCLNCGRTANNGGWYADGRTRCPIEEHYALPKDGYCHLWEKRNVTDDDYPERREEGGE